MCMVTRQQSDSLIKFTRWGLRRLGELGGQLINLKLGHVLEDHIVLIQINLALMCLESSFVYLFSQSFPITVLLGQFGQSSRTKFLYFDTAGQFGKIVKYA